MVRPAVMLLAAVAVVVLSAAIGVSGGAVTELTPADMHTHSTHSDGTDSQSAIVKAAAGLGLGLVAITDHDQLTIDPEAVRLASTLGISLLFGTEISAEWSYTRPTESGQSSGKAHVLGYYVADTTQTVQTQARFKSGRATLQRALAAVRMKRDQRNELILSSLKTKFGFDVSMDEVMHEAAGDNKTPGRPHVARVMVKKGYVPSVADAFKLYLSDQRLPLERWGIDLVDAVQLIHDAGGVAVLAHPSTLQLDLEFLEVELSALQERVPLTGLECYSSRHTAFQAQQYVELATKRGLIVTGGSDYHGKLKANTPLGVFAIAGADDSGWRKASHDSLAAIERIVSHRIQSQNAPAFKAALYSVFWNGFQYVMLFVFLYALFNASVIKGKDAGGSVATLTRWLNWATGSDTEAAASAAGAGGAGASAGASEKVAVVIDGSAAAAVGASGGAATAINIVDSAPVTKPAGGGGAKPKSDRPVDLKLFALAAAALLFLLMIFGFLQERIMTVPYGDGPDDRYQYSELLVFVNRFSALCFATLILKFGSRPNYPHAPAVRYGAASMSNIGSTWAQYEALRFISFPLQVLSKTAKPLFTMFGGAILRGVKYSTAEYLSCVLLTIGLLFFSYNEAQRVTSTMASDSRFLILGAALILLYIMCDSYTSNFQKVIYDVDKVTEFQLMQGMNACACVISGGLALLHSQFFAGLAFCMSHPLCLFHVLVMSTVSAFSQTCIMFINRRFGPMYLTMTTTTRQFASSVLSILWFGHPITAAGWSGLMLVFVGAFILLKTSKR